MDPVIKIIEQEDIPFSKSLSAQGVDALLPVQVQTDSELYKQYVSVFYPGRLKKTRGIIDDSTQKRKKKVTLKLTDKVHYFQLANYLSELSESINTSFAFLRGIVYSPEGTDYSRDLINLCAMQDQESVEKKAKEFITTAGSGRMHVIKPSTKFKGGYDIIYSGIPSYDPGTGSCLSVRTHAELDPVPATLYSPEKKAPFQTPKGTIALELAGTLLKSLLGEGTGAGSCLQAHLRHSNILPIDFNFNKVVSSTLTDSRALKSLGVSSLGDFKFVPTIPDDLSSSLNQFFSILINAEPNISQVKQQYSGRAVSQDPDKQAVCNEYMTLQPDITFSIVAHLPEEVVSYITQTPKGKQVSLVALNNWASIWSRALLRAPNAKSKDKVRIKNVPRYIITPSATSSLNEARKTLGFYSEEGRSNSDDLYVSNTGRLNYCPKASDLALDNAKNYEVLLERALKLSFDAGSPLNSNQTGETHPMFSVISPEYRTGISRAKKDLEKFSGCLQAYNWDYNCILTSSASDPDKLVSTSLLGATRPDELTLADYLKKPYATSMALLFNSSFDSSRKQVSEDTFGSFGDKLLDTTLFKGFISLYAILYAKGKVPSLQELVSSAAKEMRITTLAPGSVEDIEASQYEVNLYKDVLHDDLKVLSAFIDPKEDVSILVRYNYGIYMMKGMSIMLAKCMRDAYGDPRSNLVRVCNRNGVDAVDDPHYFSATFFTLAEFKNIYNYLGGRVLLKAFQAVQAQPKKDLFLIDTTLPDEIVHPNFNTLVKEVMPMVYILGKYVVHSDEIYEKADELIAANKKDPGINSDDIRIPAKADGFQMFPHQVEANQSLRGTPPRFAVLDIAPGGGKTTLLLSDIACLVNDGLIKRPMVLCPNGLVRNWIEDMVKVTGGTWNMIPITTLTYRSWGDERLTEIIKNAPRNTIVVAGFTVTKLDAYSVVLGNHVEKVSGTLEFLKKFGFDYVAVDECHKTKNASSGIHKAVKQLCISSTVKYVRLATGTLISNKLTDVVGQAALFSSQIFRTADEYEAENSEKVGDSKVFTWKEETPRLAREQLARHCSVISMKRKEWAFMLPRPIETFIPVRLDKDSGESGKAHQLMYDAILKETLEEIKKNADIIKLIKGGSEEDDEDDEDDDTTDKEANTDDDLDDATLLELEAQLAPYLARLEQLLTDPLGDPFGEIYFKDVDPSTFVSNKVKKVIERIRLNFVDFPWEKGKSYNLKDIVDYDGLRYVLMGTAGEKLTLESYETKYTSTIPPSKDPRWVEESRGKVIVFCRYTRTVNAIYKALPPDLKKIAVKFHGKVGKPMPGDIDISKGTKWDNLDAFKANPYSLTRGAQILIANEQGMSEGHNLQAASRLVRVESPWAPGELDQSSSRIFRPDPTRKFKRENIYLDWVLTNNTLEVSKLGRLVSKMLVKTKFDESGNTLYDPLKDHDLPLIRMNLDTIAAIPELTDISDYLTAYQVLAHIQGAEFEEMRQTKPSQMLEVSKVAALPDAAIIEHLPYVPNLELVDRHNFGLVKLTEYLEDTDNDDVKAAIEDKKILVGFYVHTEFGNGLIVDVSQTGKNGDPGATRKISSVKVQLASGDIVKTDASMLYLATNLTEANVREFTPTNPWATRSDKLKAERRERAEERARIKEEARQAKERATILGSVTSTRPKRPGKVEDVISSIEMYQVIYNGFLAVEALPEDPNDKTLVSYDYNKFGEYAYIMIPNAIVYEAVLDFMEARFIFSSDTIKRLNLIADTFKTRGKKAFDSTLAPLSEFKNFYTLRHRISTLDKATKKPVIKVYPVVMNGQLMLNIDIDTNPAIKKVLYKAIPGCTQKFDDAHSFYIRFFSNKTELKRHIKELKTAGIEISNYEELVDDIEATNFKTGMR